MSRHPLTDVRRKRILYRATHRGTKEADFVVGGFFSAAAGQLTEGELDEAEALLDASDPDLMDWLMEQKPLPKDREGPVYKQLKAHFEALKQRENNRT